MLSENFGAVTFVDMVEHNIEEEFRKIHTRETAGHNGIRRLNPARRSVAHQENTRGRVHLEQQGQETERELLRLGKVNHDVPLEDVVEKDSKSDNAVATWCPS